MINNGLPETLLGWRGIGLAILFLFPAVLLGQTVRFLPSAEWQAFAVLPAQMFAVFAAIGWLVYKVVHGKSVEPQPWRNPAIGFAKRLMEAVFIAALGYVTVIATIPGVLALVFGGTTVQIREVQTNFYGSDTVARRHCFFPLPLADDTGGLFGKVCMYSSQEKLRAKNFGTIVPVELHGWGNGFGIYYWATIPSAPKGDNKP